MAEPSSRRGNFYTDCETKADTAAETAEWFLHPHGAFSFRGMGDKPHDTAHCILKLHRVLRLFIGPEQRQPAGI